MVEQCTVLEVKVIEGHGTTIDVVLVNCVLHEGDQIVVCGLQASINLVIYNQKSHALGTVIDLEL